MKEFLLQGRAAFKTSDVGLLSLNSKHAGAHLKKYVCWGAGVGSGVIGLCLERINLFYKILGRISG